MAYLRFTDSKELHRCNVIPSENIVTLKFSEEVVVSTAGFFLFLDEKAEVDIGGRNYFGFNTIYRNDDVTAKYNGYQLSNDGSVYVAPEPKPEPEQPVEPEPYVPILEEVKSAKLVEIENGKNQAVSNGAEFDGYRFGYAQEEQLAVLKAFEMAVQTDSEVYVNHVSGSVKMGAEKLKQLFVALESNEVYHLAYSEQLKAYVNTLVTKEEVEAVYYGLSLTGDFLELYKARYNEAVNVVIEYAEQLHYANADDVQAINDALEGMVV